MKREKNVLPPSEQISLYSYTHIVTVTGCPFSTLTT